MYSIASIIIVGLLGTFLSSCSWNGVLCFFSYCAVWTSWTCHHFLWWLTVQILMHLLILKWSLFCFLNVFCAKNGSMLCASNAFVFFPFHYFIFQWVTVYLWERGIKAFLFVFYACRGILSTTWYNIVPQVMFLTSWESLPRFQQAQMRRHFTWNFKSQIFSYQL